MKIYFDNCSLQRPLDDQTQPRIEAEAAAVVAILSLCETGDLIFISSDVVQLEINEISDLQRRKASLDILEIVHQNISLDTDIEIRAQELQKHGIKSFDALHLASAEAGEAEYFCTCDDKLLRKAKAHNNLRLKVVSPIELLEEILK